MNSQNQKVFETSNHQEEYSLASDPNKQCHLNGDINKADSIPYIYILISFFVSSHFEISALFQQIVK